jgi:hypothetical protein
MGLRTMAISTCAKCEGHTFERGLVTPLGEQRVISVLQCAGCGSVIGTLDAHLALERLQTQVAGIDAGLVKLGSRRRFRRCKAASVGGLFHFECRLLAQNGPAGPVSRSLLIGGRPQVAGRRLK